MANNQAQIKQLFKEAAQGSQLALILAAKILQLVMQSLNGLQQLQQIAEQDPDLGNDIATVIKMMQGGVKARLGAKLNYILQLTAPKFACGGKSKKKKMGDGSKMTKHMRKVVDTVEEKNKQLPPGMANAKDRWHRQELTGNGKPPYTTRGEEEGNKTKSYLKHENSNDPGAGHPYWKKKKACGGAKVIADFKTRKKN